jgi:hypothetical protein
MMAAVYVRRFSPRGMALGMVAFISYFFALFLHATVAQLPALAIAVIIGVACSLLMRTIVVRDRPERELARVLRAFRARLGAVIGAAAEGLSDGSLGPRSRRRLQYLLIRLNDAALMVEDRIDDGAASEPALQVFDAELATERLAGLTVRVLDLDPAARCTDPHSADLVSWLRCSGSCAPRCAPSDPSGSTTASVASPTSSRTPLHSMTRSSTGCESRWWPWSVRRWPSRSRRRRRTPWTRRTRRPMTGRKFLVRRMAQPATTSLGNSSGSRHGSRSRSGWPAPSPSVPAS